MNEPLDQAERRELCDLFLRLGPDGPTLCEGSTALDLAAHLGLREHFKRWGAERLTAEKAKGMPDLVQQLRHGAPLIPVRSIRVAHHAQRCRVLHPPRGRPPSQRHGPATKPFRSRETVVADAQIPRAPSRNETEPTAIHLIADDGRRHSFGSGNGVAFDRRAVRTASI